MHIAFGVDRSLREQEGLLLGGNTELVVMPMSSQSVTTSCSIKQQ